MARVTRTKAQDPNTEATLVELEDKPKKAVGPIARSNIKIKEIQADETRMSLLVELAMVTEYWWNVCAGVTQETVGSKLANAYNSTLGLTGEEALTWREANRCFNDYKNKFRAENRDAEWTELLAKEKGPSLRAAMLRYLDGEANYRTKVMNGEIATLSDTSDNEEDEDDGSEDTDVVLLPSPALSNESRPKPPAKKKQKRAPAKKQAPPPRKAPPAPAPESPPAPPAPAKKQQPVPEKVLKALAKKSKRGGPLKESDKDKLIVDLYAKLDKLAFEHELLKVRLDEIGQDNVQWQIDEEKIASRLSILETDMEARVRVLESRYEMAYQGN